MFFMRLVAVLFLISIPAVLICGIVAIVAKSTHKNTKRRWGRRVAVAVACLVVTFIFILIWASSEESSNSPSSVSSSPDATASLESVSEPTLTPIPTVTPSPTSAPIPTPTAEILFRDLPWGISSSEALEVLGKTGSWFLYENASIHYPETLLDFSVLKTIANGGNQISAFDLSVGGYDVFSAELHFAYEVGDEKIDKTTDEFYGAKYLFDVVDHETVYKSLQNKLTELYGAGDESTNVDNGWIFTETYSGSYETLVHETTWIGTNGASVILRWDDVNKEELKNYEQVVLVYRSGNAEDTLDNLQEALVQEQIEEERKTAVSGGNDGL